MMMDKGVICLFFVFFFKNNAKKTNLISIEKVGRWEMGKKQEPTKFWC